LVQQCIVKKRRCVNYKEAQRSTGERKAAVICLQQDARGDRYLKAGKVRESANARERVKM
jgi:hypothetical protein